MRKRLSIVLACVFVAAFAVGLVAAPTKTVRNCITYSTNVPGVKIKCCIIEDHAAQVSYEECFYYIA